MKIYNLPKYQNKHLYNEIISKKVDILRKLPWVIDIFQIGSVGCPGVSDVDLLVITKDNGFDGTGHNIKTKDSEYFFLHDALWLREKDLEFLPYLFCTDIIYSPVIDDKPIPVKKYKLTESQKLIFLVEISFNKLLQLHSGSKEEIDARGLFTRASSIIHSVALAKELNIKNIDMVKEFGNSIKNLRNEWITSKGTVNINYEKIYNGYSNALVNLLESFIEQKSAYFEARPSPSIKVFFNSLGIHNSKNFIYDPLNKKLNIPHKLLNYFSGYDERINTPLGETQYKRKCLLQDHMKYLIKNNLTYSLRSVPAVPLTRLNRYSSVAKNLIKRKFTRKT